MLGHMASLGIEPWLYLVASTVILVAAVAQSSLGLGFGIVAAPVLALIDPMIVPGPLLVLGLLISLLVVVRDRSELRFGSLGYALLGRILASILGALAASTLNQREFMILFAALILLAVALSLTGRRISPTRGNLFVAGSASGFMGTITSVGAPPMALVYLHSAGGEARANMSAFLAAGALVSIVSLVGFGAFNQAAMTLAVSLVPALLVGFALSGFVKPLTDNGWMRPLILLLCVLASLTLLARSFELL